MTWPDWLQHLAETYLRDDASVFLLHGPGIDRGRWHLDGHDEDVFELVTRFLTRTRPIVGVQRPDRPLSFPGIGDVGNFERLVAARALISGTQATLRDDVPDQAAAKIWMALESPDPSQGYLLGDLRSLAPAKKDRPALACDTPHLEDWCSADRIRQANHVVILLTPQLDGIHRELIQSSHVIRVPDPSAGPPMTTSDPIAPRHPEDPQTAEAPLTGPVPSGDLFQDLDAEIAAQCGSMDAASHAAKLPVLAAVAEVLRRRTGFPGVLQWSVDPDGVMQVTGPQAQEFVQRWKADIALDAAASRLMTARKESGDGTLDPVGMRVLTKRLGRWLQTA